MKSAIQIADEFVAAINAGDVEGMAALMTSNHVFVDADGSQHGAREEMKSGWHGYFEMVPDFQIEVTNRFGLENTVVLLGRASGTFVQEGELRPENHWSVPAAWRVVVDSGSVAVWQLYANQHLMHQILERINASAKRHEENEEKRD